jgi:hypothetical protein
VTDRRELRAAILAELAGLRLWLAEVRCGAIRRGAELSRRRDECRSGHARAALLVTAREVLAVAEASENALSILEGDLAELLVDTPAQERGVRGGGPSENS